jgi:hypothetical protein
LEQRAAVAAVSTPEAAGPGQGHFSELPGTSTFMDVLTRYADDLLAVESGHRLGQ